MSIVNETLILIILQKTTQTQGKRWKDNAKTYVKLGRIPKVISKKNIKRLPLNEAHSGTS